MGAQPRFGAAVSELCAALHNDKHVVNRSELSRAEMQLLLACALRADPNCAVDDAELALDPHALIEEALSLFLYHKQIATGWASCGVMMLARVQASLLRADADDSHRSSDSFFSQMFSVCPGSAAGVAMWERFLGIWTRNSFPRVWSYTRIATAWLLGDGIDAELENFMETIHTLNVDAVGAMDKSVDPLAWAYLMNNIAVAYMHRTRGSRCTNIEIALSYFELAFTVFKKDSHPYEWSITLSNIADAYLNRIVDVRTRNINRAMACLHCALEALTPDTFPDEVEAIHSTLEDIEEEGLFIGSFFGTLSYKIL